MFGIITAFYNARKNVNSYLKSLENQESKNFTIILVDNNSTDGSYEYIENYLKTSSLNDQTILLKEPKQGQLYALIAGMKYAMNIGIKNVMLLDIDSSIEDKDLVRKIGAIDAPLLESNYFFMPMRYKVASKTLFGIFVGSYEDVLIDTVYKSIGWFASGSSSILPLERTLKFYEGLSSKPYDKYFTVPEKDLRLSLDLLQKGFGYCLHKL